VELLPERWAAGAGVFQRLLALLTLIPTILLARFNDRPLQEICTMAGLTVDDFTQSVA
jgi:hypothetical protein